MDWELYSIKYLERQAFLVVVPNPKAPPTVFKPKSNNLKEKIQGVFKNGISGKGE